MHSKKRGGNGDMAFWITMSITLFVIVCLSAFGPMIGLYGDMEHKGEGDTK